MPKTIRRLALIASAGVGLAALVAPAAHAQTATAVTLPATQVTTTSAVLNGDVQTRGEVAQWNFQYGTTTNYDNFTPIKQIPNGQGTMPVFWTVTNLSPNTTYHFELSAISGIATNYVEVDHGGDQSFTTMATGKLLLTSNQLTVSGKLVKVRMRCRSKLACKGHFHVNTVKRNHTIGCATGSFTIPAGKKRGITVAVSSRCRALLRATAHHRIRARFTARLRTGQQGVPKQIPLVLG